MPTRRALLAATAASATGALRHAWARGTAVALVIGNAGYRSVTPLQNPLRDARAVAILLEALGIRAEAVPDADRATMRAALARLAQRTPGADLALVYFAGHGIQRRGENWLVPVDAQLQAGTDPARQLVGLEEVIRAIAPAAQRVVVLDACRDDPLAGSTAADRGLARIEEAPAGSLVCFATSPGGVALDGDGEHSPFTDALLDHLGAPGLELRQVLTRVRRRVLLATGGRQVPWDTSSLTSDIVLRDPALAAVPRPNLNPAPPPAPARPARQGQPAPPPPAPRPPGPLPGGEVRFDAARFREIPAAYAEARRLAIALPDGLLVERRNAAGEELPLAGAYVSTYGMQVLLSYDTAQRTASLVEAWTFAPGSRRPPGWRHWVGSFDAGVVIRSSGNTVERRVDLNSGWVMAMDIRRPDGLLMQPVASRIRRVE